MTTIGAQDKDEIRRQLLELIQGKEAQLHLAHAALLIAKEEYPSLAVDTYLQRLDELARAAAARLGDGATARAKVDALNAFLFQEQGFRGNQENYYDPANSYLNEVLDRRAGIPITLALVYTEVGQRVGLPVFGVGFPGHFLIRYLGSGDELLIDAFFGTVLSQDQCLQRLRTIYGPAARLDQNLLRPASPREVIVRLLRNLKQVYVQRKDWERALACCDRILLLAPDVPEELRDRGLLYEHLECFSAALPDLERFLQLAPNDPQAGAVRERIPALRLAVAQLN